MVVALHPRIVKMFEPTQFAAVQREFRRTPEVSMYGVISASGAPPEAVLALMAAVERAGAGDLFYHAYHSCEEHPVDVFPLSEGFRRGALVCEGCDDEIDASDLSYDVICFCREMLSLEPTS